MINDFLSSGYQVEYWNITEIYRSIGTFTDELNERYALRFDELSKVDLALNELDRTTSIVFVPFKYSKQFKELFTLLQKHELYLAGINIYPDSALRIDLHKFPKVLLFSYPVIKMLFKNIFNMLTQYFEPRIDIGIFNTYFSSINPRTNSINNPNFEIFKTLHGETDRLLDYRYILFADSFFPLHPECLSVSGNTQKLATQYHERMRHFFTWLEDHFKMPVVIAAHPSATYSENEFGDRTIIKHKTAALTKDAEIVIQHGSLSYIFAVLFNKPIAFVRTNQMDHYQNLFAGYKISYLAHLFGKKGYNIDNVKYDKIDFSKVDNTIREKYIYSEITSRETENKLNSEIVLETFAEIFAKLEQEKAQD